MNNNDQVLLSVCVVTYNQENYIEECLESLISQQTNFKFEIIVGEDFSTDGTRVIVQSYFEKYPHLIVPILHDKNVGALENIKQVYLSAKGKYIAHMDGDDLALPGKLQKQFDVLRNNPDCIICSHNVAVLDNQKDKLDYKSFSFPQKIYKRVDLIRDLPFFAHSSKMFVNINDINWNEFLTNPEMIDIDIHLEQTKYGDIYHISEALGIYRINVGITAIVTNKINSRVVSRVNTCFSNLLIEENGENLKIVKKGYSEYLLKLVYEYTVVECNTEKVRKYYIEALKMHFWGGKQILFFLFYISPYFSLKIVNLLKSIKRTLMGLKNNFWNRYD